MKKFLLGLLVGITVTAYSTALADTALTKVEAYLNPSLSIKLDGNNLSLQNAPLTYNGDTYLPLRETATLLGKDVKWNDSSKAIELSSSKNGGTKMLDLQTLISHDYATQYDKDKNLVTITIDDDFYSSYNALQSDQKLLVCLKLYGKSVGEHISETPIDKRDNVKISLVLNGANVLDFQDLGIDNGKQDINLK